jgi:hypothetical protein
LNLRELIDELVSAWQSGDALRASAFFSADATYHESGREPVRGREAIAAYFTRFFRDGPPWRFEIFWLTEIALQWRTGSGRNTTVHGVCAKGARWSDVKAARSYNGASITGKEHYACRMTS